MIYLGLRSALTPEEIRAAEAAEALIEQERKDAELALRLQVSIKKILYFRLMFYGSYILSIKMHKCLDVLLLRFSNHHSTLK